MNSFIDVFLVGLVGFSFGFIIASMIYKMVYGTRMVGSTKQLRNINIELVDKLSTVMADNEKMRKQLMEIK